MALPMKRFDLLGFNRRTVGATVNAMMRAREAGIPRHVRMRRPESKPGAYSAQTSATGTAAICAGRIRLQIVALNPRSPGKGPMWPTRLGADPGFGRRPALFMPAT